MADPSLNTSTYTPSASPKGSDYAFSLNQDLKALNAAVLVITQKIKYLVRNEKILGRNLIVINKRVRDLQTQAGSAGSQGISDEVRSALQKVQRDVNAISQRLAEMENKMDDLSQRAAKEEEVKESKYIIDNINPLHLITMEQAQQMIDKNKK